MPGTRKLGRTTAQRTAMLRAMVTFLLEKGKIETTVTTIILELEFAISPDIKAVLVPVVP